MRDIIPQHIAQILTTLHDAGEQAFIVGGAVRDHLLGLSPKDFDITTSASPERVGELFDKVLMVGASFGVAVVVTEEEQVEVAQFRSECGYDGRRPDKVVLVTDPQQDVVRRDFTINGLLYDFAQDKVIDYVGGVDDLNDGIVRTIGNPIDRFQEDRLRLLRAVRIATTKGLVLDMDTKQAIADNASLLGEEANGNRIVSWERVKDELDKILTCDDRKTGFLLLDSLGLLEQIIPEVNALKGCTQPDNWHPEGDVFVHTSLVLDALRSPCSDLAYAALLHDIGKPATRKIRDGRITFYGHEDVGARIAVDILRRLKASRSTIARVEWLVQNHMRFHKIQRMRQSKVSHLFDRQDFKLLAELGRADRRGTLRTDDEEYEAAMQLYNDYIADDGFAGPSNKKMISGKEIIDLGVPRGPLIGLILGELDDARREGEIRNKGEAVALAQGLIGELKRAGKLR